MEQEAAQKTIRLKFSILTDAQFIIIIIRLQKNTVGKKMCDEQSTVKAIMNALGAHGAWKLRLRTAVAIGTSAISPSQARCDKSCEFGKWLHGATMDAETRRGKPWQVVSRLHREFHQCASSILEKALAGKREEANALLATEFAQRSDTLGRALQKWRSELVNGSSFTSKRLLRTFPISR